MVEVEGWNGNGGVCGSGEMVGAMVVVVVVVVEVALMVAVEDVVWW